MSARTVRVSTRLHELGRTLHERWARAILVMLVALLTGVLSGVRLNVTPSYPLGLYVVDRDAPDAVRGSIVTVCLPEPWAQFGLSRGYLGYGWCTGGSYPLGKMVLAAGGDVVETSPNGIKVNGRAVIHSRALPRDARGRRLRHYPFGRHQLREGELWLFSPYTAAAFDSRYFGTVRRERVQAVVQPMWTWR